jgi:hypothetical protein
MKMFYLLIPLLLSIPAKAIEVDPNVLLERYFQTPNACHEQVSKTSDSCEKLYKQACERRIGIKAEIFQKINFNKFVYKKYKEQYLHHSFHDIKDVDSDEPLISNDVSDNITDELEKLDKIEKIAQLKQRVDNQYVGEGRALRFCWKNLDKGVLPPIIQQGVLEYLDESSVKGKDPSEIFKLILKSKEDAVEKYKEYVKDVISECYLNRRLSLPSSKVDEALLLKFGSTYYPETYKNRLIIIHKTVSDKYTPLLKTQNDDDLIKKIKEQKFISPEDILDKNRMKAWEIDPMKDILTGKNASYFPIGNNFQFYSGMQFESDDLLSMVIAHEFGHSLSYSANPGSLAFYKVKSSKDCLSKMVSDKEVKLKEEQLEEAFADVIAAEFMANKYEASNNETVLSNLSLFCKYKEDEDFEDTAAGKEAHLGNDRVIKFYLSNPKIQKILGCEPETIYPYCGEDFKIK